MMNGKCAVAKERCDGIVDVFCALLLGRMIFLLLLLST